ncbi:hypothetical protein BDA99DRAFT_543126 [Phascolomyces articulosus]|uniref:SH3 domain-containing protein n=1 Tax=Phascolomyces articulosus TaxID=60185 RepID=A0AAD5JNF8_9FUNG|nr:hypothetical protein BDA99DRAFT_543126 [Phascolomyces articulosus]
MDVVTNENDYSNHFLNKRAPEESAVSDAKPTPTKKPEPSPSASAADKPKSSNPSFANDKSQSITAFPEPTPSTTTTPPYHIKPSTTQTPEQTVAADSGTSDTATATVSVASSEDEGSSISGGAIGGIVVAVIAAIALSLIAILFVRRRKRTTRRRPSISHRVSSFGQNDFFAGPTMGTTTATHNLQTSPPMMQQQLQPQTYGSMNVPPMVAAGPVTTPTEYYTPALAAHQPNSTFAPAPAFAATAASPPMQQQQQQQQQPVQEPWQHPPLGTYTVVSTYTPTLDDEIYVHPGDQVQVYTEYDDGWCLGSNLSRGNARGVFPLHCIQASTSPSMASSSATGGGGGGQNLNANDPRLSKRGSSLYNYNEVARQF